MSSLARPILVTGSHRSGTTWTGTLLSLSGEALSIHEPFNPGYERSWLARQPTTWFQHVDAETAAEWQGQLEQVVALRPPVRAMLTRRMSARHVVRVAQEAAQAALARRKRMRPLLKDPIAFFTAEWFHHTFDADVLVLVRHPAAFASSLKRMNWTFDFSNFVRQERLMTSLTDAARRDVHDAASDGQLDIIDTSILLWRVINGSAHRLRQASTGIVVRRYEDLADNAVASFETLYSDLGLSWSSDVASAVLSYTRTGNVADVADGDRGGVARDSRAAMWTWTNRLSVDEVKRVRSGTEAVASHFYSDSDWDPPAT